MRIGIYGGTFNPIHFGHLRVAEEILHKFKLRQVIFVPSADPPHKDPNCIIDPLYRLKMTNLAITGNEAFTASDVETSREGKSYSIDTVRILQEQHPECRMAFIMGLDAFLEIHTWHKYQELFSACDIIVTTRPGVKKISPAKAVPEKVRDKFKRKRNKEMAEFIHESGHGLYFIEVSHIGISGTAIRTMVRGGESIRYLTPRRVMDFITENHLYTQ